MIYLDNAATTFPKPEIVYSSVEKRLRAAFNASRGGYKVAREANEIVRNVRQKILSLANSKGEVHFSSSATIAINEVIHGIELNQGDVVYVSPFEHNAILRPLKRIGVDLKVMSFDPVTWELDFSTLQDDFLLDPPKALLISSVSNVTGYILPFREIFEEAKKYEAITILDAAQSFGIVDLKLNSDIDFVIFAGHKSLYGVFGVAGIINNNRRSLIPMLYGGTGSESLNLEMRDNLEAGSLDINAIASLEASIDWLNSVDVYSHERHITKYLIEQMLIIPKISVYLPENLENHIGIVAFSHEDYSSNDIGEILDDEFDIAVRTGFHCAALIHSFLGTDAIGGVVRISIGAFTTEEDIDLLTSALRSL